VESQCQPTNAPDPFFPPISEGPAAARVRTICLVIPTKNEEKTIALVLRSAKAAIAAIPSLAIRAIILVDDSCDGTREIAKAEGCVVVSGGGTGLGAAMLKGIHQALDFDPEFILSLDSDGQVDLAEIPDFLEPVLNGSADLVLGSRFLKEGLIRYRYPRINRIGIILLCFILRQLTGLKVTDSHGGIRAMTSRVARDLEILGTHTYVQEAIIDASLRGFRIRELPTVWLPREAGESRVVQSIPRYVNYTLPIILVRRGLHLWLYYGMGLLFLLSGAFHFVGSRGSLFQASCYLFFALSAFFFGFATELLVRQRSESLRREMAHG
jgi:glycosyltransferase involved in cell wall biosynthesis